SYSRSYTRNLPGRYPCNCRTDPQNKSCLPNSRRDRRPPENGISHCEFRIVTQNRANLMFTGLVEALATIVEIRSEPPGVRLSISIPLFTGEVQIGDSIALNGCCLTVVAMKGERFEFQAVEETLQ